MRDLTEIICILDRSGSMSSIKSSVIENFNSFVASQRAVEGDARMTMYTFNNVTEKLYEAVSLADVAELNNKNYKPDNGTALYDAIGEAINSTGKRLASMDESERPNKVVVIILTDGEENASRTFNNQQIAEMIEHQKTVYSWQFIFMGANQDAALSAQTLNISANNAMYFSSSEVSMQKSVASLNNYMTRTRGMSSEIYSASLDNALADEEKDMRDPIDLEK